MAVYFFLHSVLYALAIYCIAEKIIEKLQKELIDDVPQEMLQEIVKYVAAQSGDKLTVASIRRSLGYLLSIAGLYIVKQIGDYVVEKIKGYAVEKIGEYVVAPVRDNVVAPIRRKLGYLRFYKSNIKDFRTQMENLKNTRDDVQRRVDDAKRNGEVILPNVREWQTNVNEVIVESTNIFEDEHQLNLKLRYQQSRNAKERTSNVDKLAREGNSFDRVSTYALAFESRKLIFDKIMEAVKDDGIGMIGIYGMGGVGKTTLAKEVVQQAKDDNLFDAVLMAVVSQTPDLRKIQGEIADMLSLKFDAERVPGRARQLSARLQEMKRILVILDDVWETVELEDIGIPFGAKHKVCKIVLTTRSQDVCNQMKAERNFLIDVLFEQEGWNLFRKMAGDSVGSPDLHDVAVEIAKECAGLPLAIVTIAKALEGKRLFHWKDARNKLRKSIPDEKVILCLELSYKHLGSDEAKSFFLLCCLYPVDWNIEIQDLMKYGMGLGLFENVETVDEARERAHSLASSLKSSCLLLDGSDEESVKMHDVIRDVALKIASKVKHAFLERAGLGWKEWPKNDTYKRNTAISVLSDDIHELPDERECPELRILLLICRHPSFQFPKYFFLRMDNLNVLDMSSMNFLLLPPSLRYLKNLRTLCLDFCKFEDTLSIIGELEKLEILSLRGSNIKQLPKEIGILDHLTLLDLTGCDELAMIPPDVIRNLSQLEGLYMEGSFDKWEIEREDKERSNASLEELNHLSRLINLEIHIPDANLWPKDLLFESLSRFIISVGTSFEESDEYSNSKVLELELDVSTGLKDGIKGLLKKVEDLRLRKMKGLKSVVYDLDREGFQDLRHLIVEECGGLEYIFNASERVSLVAFPFLEKLDLNDLENLKEICNGRLPSGFFSKLQELRLIDLPELKKLWKDPAQHVCLHNLTVVEVEDCDGLKNLFSHSEAKGLSKLVELEVRKCRIMEEIVGNEKESASAAGDDIVFPHLRSLKLGYLPNLRNFCSKMKGDLDTSTEEPLFDKKVAFPVLETLEIVDIGNLIEIWHSQLLVKSFSQLKVLKVEDCHKVSKIVAFNLLKRLLSLEVLSLNHCDLVEEIIGVEGLVVEEGHATETPFQLRELELRKLPKLKHIMRWDMYPHRTLAFQNLSSIHIDDCNSLKSLFSPSMASSLLQLKELEIFYCKMMESIIAEEREGEENCKKIVVFPELRTLKLLYLPKLISFMKTFTPIFSIQQKHMITDEIVKAAPQEGNLRDPLQPLFDQKVAFPALETLRIYHTGNLMENQHSQLLASSFSRLKVLKVKHCHEVSKVVPFHLLRSLEKLSLKDCESVDEIVEVEGLVVEERHLSEAPFQLRELKLWKLPKLKHIMRWDIYAHGTLGFPNLSSIDVYKCNNLKSLFSPSMASSLLQLQEVEIHSCKMMESIIAEEREGEENCKEIIVFPQLRTLKFQNLPKLIGFMKTFDQKVSFPQLKVLNVEGCHKVSKVVQFNLLLSLEKLNVKKCDSLEEVVEVEMEEVVEVVEEMLNQLRELKLWELPKLKHIMQCDKYPHRILGFRNLSSIHIYQCNSLRSLFSPSITNCLAQLKEVIINSCEMMESIITEEREGEENWEEIIVFPQLCTLKLENLPKLISFMKTIQQPLFNEKVAFTNLVELHITDIENLQEIFHTRLADESFSQLRILEVIECHKLSRVAPSNLLPRLQNLETLIVNRCNSMEKIFELEGEGCTPISLSLLGCVALHYLPNLMMFCSGKYDFELPSLEIFRFEKCPKMQTFSDGLKSTPNLKRAYVEWSEGVWKGDLNSTIYHLFQQEPMERLYVEIEEPLYLIKDLVYGLHLRKQESSVQEDEDKDEEKEELGEKSEEANIEEQEGEENISPQALHHVIPEEVEEEGHQKGSLEAIREHLKVMTMTNLLNELGVEEEEEGESEKVGEANIEELQEINVLLKQVILLVEYYRGLPHRKFLVEIRRRLKRMMDLVDFLGLREQELSKAKLQINAQGRRIKKYKRTPRNST